MDEQWSFTRPSATMPSDEWVPPSLLVGEHPTSSLFDQAPAEPAPTRPAGQGAATHREAPGPVASAPTEQGRPVPGRARQAAALPAGAGITEHFRQAQAAVAATHTGRPDGEPAAGSAPRRPPEERGLGQPVQSATINRGEAGPVTVSRQDRPRAQPQAPGWIPPAGDRGDGLRALDQLLGRNPTGPGRSSGALGPHQGPRPGAPEMPGTSRRGFLTAAGMAVFAVAGLGLTWYTDPDVRGGEDVGGAPDEQVGSQHTPMGSFQLPAGWELLDEQADWVTALDPTQGLIRLTRRGSATLDAVALAEQVLVEQVLVEQGKPPATGRVLPGREPTVGEATSDDGVHVVWAVPSEGEWLVLWGESYQAASMEDQLTTILDSYTYP